MNKERIPYEEEFRNYFLSQGNTSVEKYISGAEKMLLLKSQFQNDSDKKIKERITGATSTKSNNMTYLKKYEEFLRWRNQHNNSDSFLLSNEVKETEKMALIKARIGQSKFRKGLIELWGGCSVTGYSEDYSILIASHIKPWAISNANERLNKFNGLLLTPNLDKLFDKGYISFNQNGKIMISNELKDFTALSINKDMQMMKIHDENKQFLDYHSKHVFKTN